MSLFESYLCSSCFSKKRKKKICSTDALKIKNAPIRLILLRPKLVDASNALNFISMLCRATERVGESFSLIVTLFAPVKLCEHLSPSR